MSRAGPRLDFRRSLVSGSFPEQRLVIEPRLVRLAELLRCAGNWAGPVVMKSRS